MKSKPADGGMDEGTEAKISSVALRQTMTEDRHDMLWALAQAEAVLDELAELGRYPRDPAGQEREADLLRLALALMRARRQGVEEAATLHAWWRDPVYGTRRPQTEHGSQRRSNPL